MVEVEGNELSLLKAGVWAVLFSVVVNVVLFLVGDALGAFPPDAIAPGPEGQARPITLGPVVILSAAGPGVGAAVYGILRRFTRRARMAFVWIAAAVLLIMAVPPFLVENAPVAQVVILQVMHLVTAGATLGMVARAR
jgi:hypothetical protein